MRDFSRVTSELTGGKMRHERALLTSIIAEMDTDAPIKATTEIKRERLRKQYREIRDFFIKAEQPDKVRDSIDKHNLPINK